MSFSGFGPQALPFLKALAFHQTKDWFEANRATYESDIKTPMGDLVEDLAAAFAKAKIPLKGDRKSSLFRIHRDVRFSKNKDPYKTNVGAVMTRIGGAKNEPGLVLFSCRDGRLLHRRRFLRSRARDAGQAARRYGAGAKSLEADAGQARQGGLAPSQDYALTRNPRGFEGVEDEAILAGLRLKSIIVSRPLPEARLANAGLVDDLVGFAREALPLLLWGWDAISDSR